MTVGGGLERCFSLRDRARCVVAGPRCPGSCTSSSIDVGADLGQPGQRLLAAGRLLDREPLALQHHAHGAADVLLVVDDEDGGGHRRYARRLPYRGARRDLAPTRRTSTASPGQRRSSAAPSPQRGSRPPGGQRQPRDAAAKNGAAAPGARARPDAPRAAPRRRRLARRATRAAPRAADQRDVVGAGVKVRAAVERVDAVGVVEPDLAQHLLDPLVSGPTWPISACDVRGQQRGVDRILRGTGCG